MAENVARMGEIRTFSRKIQLKNGSWDTTQELEGKCHQYMSFKPLNHLHFFVLGRKLILIMTLVRVLVVGLLPVQRMWTKRTQQQCLLDFTENNGSRPPEVIIMGRR